MERTIKEDIGEAYVNPRLIKHDPLIMHKVKEENYQFGDVSNKIEVKIPVLQMSFFVPMGTSEDEIKRKKRAYIKSSGIYYEFKEDEL